MRVLVKWTKIFLLVIAFIFIKALQFSIAYIHLIVMIVVTMHTEFERAVKSIEDK